MTSHAGSNHDLGSDRDQHHVCFMTDINRVFFMLPPPKRRSTDGPDEKNEDSKKSRQEVHDD